MYRSLSDQLNIFQVKTYFLIISFSSKCSVHVVHIKLFRTTQKFKTISCTYNRMACHKVSVQGVKSLWGDCSVFPVLGTGRDTDRWRIDLSSPWKSVKSSWISRMGRNFDDYLDFQPKITHPKRIPAPQCTFPKWDLQKLYF